MQPPKIVDLPENLGEALAGEKVCQRESGRAREREDEGGRVRGREREREEEGERGRERGRERA